MGGGPELLFWAHLMSRAKFGRKRGGEEREEREKGAESELKTGA